MRWIWWWIFVRNAVKSGELFFFTAFTAITAFLTKIHRIHRISYENLPKNLDPGKMYCHKITPFQRQLDSFRKTYEILNPSIRFCNPGRGPIQKYQLIKLMLRSKTRLPSNCARSCLWSELSRRKWLLTRTNSSQYPDFWATIAQTNSRLFCRRLYVWNDLWWDHNQTSCFLREGAWRGRSWSQGDSYVSHIEI